MKQHLTAYFCSLYQQNKGNGLGVVCHLKFKTLKIQLAISLQKAKHDRSEKG